VNQSQPTLRPSVMASLLSKSFTILRGVDYSGAFVWLWTWLAISVRSLDAQLPVLVPIWLRPLGFVLAPAGALLSGLCIATFVTKGRGTPAPFDPPREFVASGPYRYVRNPNVRRWDRRDTWSWPCPFLAFDRRECSCVPPDHASLCGRTRRAGVGWQVWRQLPAVQFVGSPLAHPEIEIKRDTRRRLIPRWRGLAPVSAELDIVR
jgi:hypothetical protein